MESKIEKQKKSILPIPIYVALIGAIATILGALIPAIVEYVTKPNPPTPLLSKDIFITNKGDTLLTTDKRFKEFDNLGKLLDPQTGDYLEGHFKDGKPQGKCERLSKGESFTETYDNGELIFQVSNLK